MNTLVLEVSEVNPTSTEGLPGEDWAMSDEQADALAADHEAEAAWERACELGHGAW